MNPRLYLDIDGVLNSEEGDKIAEEKFPEEIKLLKENLLKHKYFLYKHWYEVAVNNLRTILEAVKPDVYIHSTWKNHFELGDFTTFFEFWNLDATLIRGIVPRYKFSSERYHDLSWHISGDRINADEEEPCTNYVVLDDLDMRHIFEDRDVFKTRQIATNPEVGLTAEDASRAIEILEKNRAD